MLRILLVLSLAIRASSYTVYSVKDSYLRNDFLDWDWYSSSDPTHGRVNYVTKSTAIAENLTDATDTTFRMRADTKKMLSPSDPGRDSIRISSPTAYSESVFILDLWHMPTGCATWPAWWSVSKAGPWPHGGELDIIEGVNNNTQNLGSLHTLPSCTMPEDMFRYQSGATVSTNCDASVNYNQGCGVAFRKPNSFGQGFNSNGGGVYAVQRDSSGISIWFWPRDDEHLPGEIYHKSPTVSPYYWGAPEAAFPFGECDYDDHFDPHNIVFDLTFCGDWAGSAYPKSGCPSNCVDYVNNNPTAFTEAYWEIASLTVYTPVQ